MLRYIAILTALLLVPSLAQNQGGNPNDFYWEYAIAQASTYGSTYNEKAEGQVMVCVQTESGCHSQDVVVTEPSSFPTRGGQAFRLQQLAVAKTLAQMGKQGWELTSVIRESSPDQTVYYFKRRVPLR